MKKKYLVVISILILALLVGGFSSTINANEPEYVISIGHESPVNPVGNPPSARSYVFADLVDFYTGGRVEVRVYPDGQLGSQTSIFSQVQSGDIEMGSIATGPLGTVGYQPFSLFTLPYIFPSRQIADDIMQMDNPVIQEMNDGMREAIGVELVSINPEGFRNVTNSVRPIKSPNDFRGLNLRTMEVVPHQRMFSEVNANPTPIPFMEVYTSLDTGVVDGQENPVSLIVQMNFHEVQDYLTLTQHVVLSGSMVINSEFFSSLPSDIRAGIFKAAQEARNASIGTISIYDQLGIGTIENAGVEVYVPTPEEIEVFAEAMTTDAYAWYREEIDGGARYLSMIEEEIEKAESRYNQLAN